MTGNPEYAAKKMTEVIEAIATDEGDARKRVEVAFLYLHALKAEDFPDENKVDWEWIWEQATKRGPLTGPEGAIYRGSLKNTMRSIRNSTASKILKRIYSLYWAVSKNKPYK